MKYITTLHSDMEKCRRSFANVIYWKCDSELMHKIATSIHINSFDYQIDEYIKYSPLIISKH